MPSAQPGCQKAQLRNPDLGVVGGHSVAEFEQNMGVASPSSVTALKQPFRRLPAGMGKSQKPK